MSADAAPSSDDSGSDGIPWWVIAIVVLVTVPFLAGFAACGYLVYWESTCADGYDSLGDLKGSPAVVLLPDDSEEIGRAQDDCGRSLFGGERQASMNLLYGSDAGLEEVQAWYEMRMSALGWSPNETINSHPPSERTGNSRVKTVVWSRQGRLFRVEIRTNPNDDIFGFTPYEGTFWMDPSHPDDEQRTRDRIDDYETVFFVEYVGASENSRAVARGSAH